MKIEKIVFLMILLVTVISCSKTKKEKVQMPPKQSITSTVLTKPKATELTVETTDSFIAWAASSSMEEKEEVRSNIKKVSTNEGVLQELIKRFEKVDTLDVSYSLIVLSLIGELQNPKSEPWLLKQVNRPIIELKDIPHASLSQRDLVEMLSSKAVECLAYLRTKSAEESLRNIISKHPSGSVRSAAIDAYLYNHDDSKEARAILQRIVQPDDLPLLDRARFKATDSKAFNSIQEEFYKKHEKERVVAPGEASVKNIKKSDSIKIEQAISPPLHNKKN
jgi:predicted component of type VI protein secretion system